MTISIGNLVGFRGRSISGEWIIPDSNNENSFSLNLSIASGLTGDLRILIASGPNYYSETAESVLKSIAQSVNPSLINGVLITAHDFAARISELDGSDKPMYPGWPHGTNLERISFEILHNLMGQVDYALFIEGARSDQSCILHAAMFTTDDGQFSSCDPEILKAMGHDLIIVKEGTRGSLAIEADREFATPILIAQMDDSENSDDLEDWLKEKVLNFLSYAGVIDIKPVIPDKTYLAPRDCEIVSQHDGEMIFDRELGEFVTEGEKIGTITNEDMQFQVHIENPHSGYIVSHRNSGMIAAGDLICTILNFRSSRVEPGTFICDSVYNNSEMDVNLRPNVLFSSEPIPDGDVD